MIFEDRSSYDAAVDPVARVVLTVECAPGQVDSITNFLAEVAKQGGVYSVGVACDVHIPEVKVEVPRFEVPEPIEPEAPFFEPAPEVSAHVPRETVVPATEGEVHAELELQQASEPAEASAVIGGEAAPVGKPGPVDAHADGELAGPAGEVGAGPVERSAGGEGVRDGAGLEGRDG